jgi:hypothetical protein
VLFRVADPVCVSFIGFAVKRAGHILIFIGFLGIAFGVGSFL